LQEVLLAGYGYGAAFCLAMKYEVIRGGVADSVAKPVYGNISAW